MRLDKYLKVSRIFKRRTIAKEISANNRVYINDKVAKPSTLVKINDIIKIIYGNKEFTVRVLALANQANKENALSMYEVLEEKNTK
ncbi:MAG: RNA-binding S4 domain-containing protein [Firmicutes bacterium]|nr:RNA-binding S4 domain-containing protein [Bacillota bacterium]